MSETLPDGMTPAEAEHLRALAKEQLRKQLAALRRTLKPELRQAYAAQMCALLVAHEAFQQAQVVLAYSPLKFEIDPRPAFAEAWALGKTVALPRTLPETREIVPHVYCQGDPLAESGFVIQEPLVDAPRVEASQVDLVLLPGLGYDLRGQRLGFGQGYYDRLLPRLPRATRIGLAYELSLLVEVPNAAHDAPVDFVITERRVIRCVR
ncbi:MAG: 5-formyltetrahydrofolate cyclo-ligase [Myxococcaceae bacterium]|nr:5-formyltetrahydrofolate cyclo-ligase [Myxococcaceae bacterium]